MVAAVDGTDAPGNTAGQVPPFFRHCLPPRSYVHPKFAVLGNRWRSSFSSHPRCPRALACSARPRAGPGSYCDVVAGKHRAGAEVRVCNGRARCTRVVRHTTDVSQHRVGSSSRNCDSAIARPTAGRVYGKAAIPLRRGHQAALIGLPVGSGKEGYTNSVVGLRPGADGYHYKQASS